MSYKASFRNEARFFFGTKPGDSFCDSQSRALSGKVIINPAEVTTNLKTLL
ncbi:hypothetical protein [Aquimarina sp. Aq78]|uniref:hypothetical protein n=1 Tax=Aquimarina sp. Aq78 TaxID=1191889 RepID=UPI00131DF3F2|nr:hypothetical protein [Aquimarina sp. Aq78]